MDLTTKEVQAFKDRLAINLFGVTLEEAQQKNICICCKASVDTAEWSPIYIDEWLLSGLCPTCFDAGTNFGNDEDEENNEKEEAYNA